MLVWQPLHFQPCVLNTSSRWAVWDWGLNNDLLTITLVCEYVHVNACLMAVIWKSASLFSRSCSVRDSSPPSSSETLIVLHIFHSTHHNQEQWSQSSSPFDLQFPSLSTKDRVECTLLCWIQESVDLHRGNSCSGHADLTSVSYDVITFKYLLCILCFFASLFNVSKRFGSRSNAVKLP